MKQFSQLIKTLDSTNKTNVKVKALTEYFREADDSDKVWTIAILSHRRPPRPVNTTLLRNWAAELADIPQWLFDESYHIVASRMAEQVLSGEITPDSPLYAHALATLIGASNYSTIAGPPDPEADAAYRDQYLETSATRWGRVFTQAYIQYRDNPELLEEPTAPVSRSGPTVTGAEPGS